MKNKTAILEPMKYYLVYLFISLMIIIPGLFLLIQHGLKLSIDFTGGSNFIWKSSDINEQIIREAANNISIDIKDIKNISPIWIIRTEPLDLTRYKNLKNYVAKQHAFTEEQYETVGPSLGSELIKKTIYAIATSSTLILLYIGFRFKDFRYGVSAILAMLHDSLILLGVFSFLGYFFGIEVDTLFVTAILTVLSFSVHDTIVVYNRIRELKRKYVYLNFPEIVNRAVVETLGRSLNNSLTIVFMLLAMYLLGGSSIKWFIFALLIGTISGTYSSTFTAAPLLILWDKLAKKRLG